MADIIARAAEFARKAHYGQVRKWTNDPYFYHVTEVAGLAKDFHLDEEVQAAAYLHDTIEDCGKTFFDLKNEFGDRVAHLVLQVSDRSRLEDGTRYVRKSLIDLQYLKGAEPDAQSLKCCDLISNTKDVAKNSPGFALVYLPEKRALLEMALIQARYPIWRAAHAVLVEAEKALAAATG
jgi:(p)ppGpp synthase/HD superfamily hydrolase